MTVRLDRRKGWIVDFIYPHPDGRKERIRKRSPVPTKAGALAYERELREAAGRPRVCTPTFEEFSIEFMENHSKVNNKRSEQVSKRRILDNHLLPFFGMQLLVDVRTLQIEKFKVQQINKWLSPKTINNHLAVLSRMLNCAFEWERLPSPTRVKLLKAPKPEMRFLEFEEADRLLEGVEAGQERTMILIALRAGLRVGELLGLHWDDVDLRRGDLHVRHSYHRGHLDSPKGNRSRVVPMTDKVQETLRQHRHRDIAGPIVFHNPDGSHLTDNQTKRYAIRAFRRAHLDKPGWHILRHTFASHLVMKGATLKAVQELLGHASIEMTMRYAHLSPVSKKRAIHLLDGTHVAPSEEPARNLLER